MSVPARIMETKSVNQNQIIREKSGKRGHALMLLWLLAETHGEEAPTIPEIAEIVGVSERHVKRLIEQCEQDGDVKVTRGKGRGHHSVYHVTYLLKGDNAPFQKAARTNKTAPIKGDIKGDTSPNIKGDITSNVTPFPSEIKGDIAQPPHTPHKDILNNTNSSFANAQEEARAEGSAQGFINSEGFDSKHYIGRLLKWRKQDLDVKSLPLEGGEAKAAKWLHKNEFTTIDVWKCYRDLQEKGKDWRDSPVTLIDVKKSIADWQNGNLNLERKNESRNRGSSYSSRPHETPGGNGQPPPANDRQRAVKNRI